MLGPDATYPPITSGEVRANSVREHGGKYVTG
jgi:hypothetical protein